MRTRLGSDGGVKGISPWLAFAAPGGAFSNAPYSNATAVARPAGV